MNKSFFYNLKLAPKHMHIKDILDYDIIILPPTGPQCICTAGFETTFIKQYNNLKKSNKPIKPTTFICSSFGGYRTVSLLTSIFTEKDIVSQFYDHIIDMTYQKTDTPETLEIMMSSLRKKIIIDSAISEIIKSNDFKIIIIVDRLKPIYNYLHVYIQYMFMFFLGLVSIFFPLILQDTLFDRLCFYTGNNPKDIFPNNYFEEYHKLTTKNFNDVLKASSCIPGITIDSNFINDVGKGIYMDGGLSDINIGFKINNNYSGLILNQASSLYQNWFHFTIKYPPIPNDFYKNLSVIYPNKNYIKNIPNNRMAQINDWFDSKYIESPNKRKNDWTKQKQLSIKHFNNDIDKQFGKISSVFDNNLIK